MIKFVSDLRQVGGYLRVLWFLPPQYNWNIVESGVKHHYPPSTLKILSSPSPNNNLCLVYLLRIEFSILCLLTNGPCGVTFWQVRPVLSRRCPFHDAFPQMVASLLEVYNIFQLLFIRKPLHFYRINGSLKP